MSLNECMGRNKTYEKLWSVIRKLLLLSNGQASVEQGFSLNRQIEKDNMRERMLGALRQITDHFVLVGGMLKVEITKELLSSASCALSACEQIDGLCSRSAGVVGHEHAET